MTLLIPLMFLFSNCSKEDSVVNYDLNNDGVKDLVTFSWESFSKGKWGVSYLNNKKKMKIGEFSKYPNLPDFYDFNNDGYPEFVFYRSEKGELKGYFIKNNQGEFEETEKPLEEANDF